MKKKIGFVSLNDHVPWGGSEVFWSELAESMMANGYDVAISPKLWDDGPKKITSLLDQGVKDFRRLKKVPLPIIKRLINKGLPNAYRFRPYQDYYNILDVFKPDMLIISLGNHNSGWNWMSRCRELGIPYILIVQLVKDAHCPPENLPGYHELKEGYRQAYSIWCPSYDNKFLLEKQFAIELDQVEVINNPVKNLDKYPEYPQSETAQVAMVASLNYNHKGQDILFETIRSDKWQKRNIQFNLYGYGPHEQILKDLATYWGIKNVHFHGYAPLDEIWKENQLLLMSSRMEGLSLAFLEALNCQRTAIITKLGDSQRFIQDDKNGFLIKAPQADFLDEALERAWNRRDEWEVLGMRAKESLKDQITEDPIQKMAEWLIKQV